MPYDRLPAFFVALHQQRGIGAKSAELMILTAIRTNEVRFAPWTELTPGWPAVGDPWSADEGGSRPPYSVVGAGIGDPESFA
jgi:hypothetical protein